MRVIATATGFDGLNVRNEGDKFEVPGDPFKVHAQNHAKRQALYNAALKNWNGATPLPPQPGDEPEPLWFKEDKTKADDSDLV